MKKIFIKERGFHFQRDVRTVARRIGSAGMRIDLLRVSSTKQMSNKKNEKVRRLWERGITDPRIIAQKLGYTGNSMTAGIEWVNQALKTLGITAL